MIAAKRFKTYIIFIMSFLIIEIAYSQCIIDSSPVWEKYWESCIPSANPNSARGQSIWIMYDFTTPHAIKSSHIWNSNQFGQSSKGVKEIVIDISKNGESWQSIGTFTIPKATEQNNYIGAPGPDFGGIFIKKILVTVLSTYDNSGCAVIGEFRFDIDKNACHDELDECGVCGGKGKQMWYIDRDGDGLGTDEYFTLSCTKPVGYVDNKLDPCDNGGISWQDINSLFVSNNCFQCHANGIELGGLDLSNYEAFSQGGNICGENILTGTTLVDIITVSEYAGCGVSLPSPSMNERVGGSFNQEELQLLQDWIDGGALESCECITGDKDSDNDGVCDAMDLCPGNDDNLIGTPCNDGDACTVADVITVHCICQGVIQQDSDNDGVCDNMDAAPHNPCTSDGIVDGFEPDSWISTPSADCDSDGVSISDGDMNDFDSCIDEHGFKSTSACLCGSDALYNGGTISFADTGIEFSQEVNGLPDGINSGFFFGSDIIRMSYPYVSIKDSICVAVGFNHPDGVVNIQIQGIEYRFQNRTRDSTFTPQLYCILSPTSGPQTIQIKDDGSGSIKMDGSYYTYCPCSKGDPEYSSPNCLCEHVIQNPGIYKDNIGVGGVPSLADGFPDGLFTGNIRFLDTLSLSFTDLSIGNKICISNAFSDSNGIMEVIHGDNTYLSKNAISDSDTQEFCFIIKNTSNQIKITDSGPGVVTVDGSYSESCPTCLPSQNDSDNDGVCNFNDHCPFSASDDSDHDGVCDNLDKCIGYNDAVDTDSDGIPDGCDLCQGFDDTIDNDQDGVPDGCDKCPNYNDNIDSDLDSIPDKCDPSPCPNIIEETDFRNIVLNNRANQVIRTNGSIKSGEQIFYRANHFIELMNDFSVESGATFNVRIKTCSE